MILSGPRDILTLLIDPTQVESKKSSQIQWPVPSINVEHVDISLGRIKSENSGLNNLTNYYKLIKMAIQQQYNQIILVQSNV